MKTLAIAAVTVRETLSRKIQATLFIFAALLLVATYLATLLTLGYSHRIVADLGLSGMELVSILLAIFLGADLVAGDVQRRVLYPVVAKPVSRTQYLLGRYVGLSAALLLNLLAMALMLSALFVFDARSLAPLTPVLAGSFAALLLKVLTVGAIAALFSSFTNTTLAAIFTLSVTIAGYLTTELRSLWQGDHAWIATLIWYALPDLGGLTTNDAVVYGTALPESLALTGLHAMVHAGLALTIAAVVLERRDFR